MAQFVTGERTIGEAAVDGLLAGLLAGVGMALYLLAAAGLGGEAPLAVLARFDVGGNASPLAGGLTHLATAAVYGAVFGGLRHLLPRARTDQWWWAAGLGLAFGLALWALAMGAWLSPESPLRGLPPVHFALAHAGYGLVLGGLMARFGR